MNRFVAVPLVLAFLFMLAGCQHPTDPDDVLSFDEAADVVVSPNPIVADTATGGRTYRVVRGNNQPDEILAYDWHATFSNTITLNSNATNDDVDVAFPIKLTATTLTVKQASAGIITPPTGTDAEKYDFVFSAGGNQMTAINQPLYSTFEIWYDLPSLRKEAVVTLSYQFTDDDGATFTKSYDVSIAP
jgi:hypothetical protein